MTYKVTEEALAHGNVCTIFLDGEIDGQGIFNF